MLGFISGPVVLIVGAELLVRGASKLALSFGISPLVVGLTAVSFGPSSPELAVSMQSAWSGRVDIALGDVVGSNIFNILAVLGISASVAPGALLVPPAMPAFDLPVMVAAAAACLPIFFMGHLTARWEGALFLAYYVAYTACLILDAAGHDAQAAFSAVMGGFALPLTALTLLVQNWRHWQRMRGGKPT